MTGQVTLIVAYRARPKFKITFLDSGPPKVEAVIFTSCSYPHENTASTSGIARETESGAGLSPATGALCHRAENPLAADVCP